jgi:putative sugar O-methyltransferase
MTGGRYPLTVLQDASVGNPFGTMMEGVFVPANSEYHHACADRILSLTGEDAKVVEIGGGYGHMAYYLLRDAPGVAYLDFDMPESLALAAYYLGRSHPERRMLLYGEESLSIHAMENHDILLMPPWEMHRLTRGCANLTFSSHVISDLTPQARELYLRYIAFFTDGYVVDIGCDPGPEWSKAYEGTFARQFRLVEKHKLDWSAYRSPGVSEWQRIHRTEPRGSM